jgi:cobalamin biosynthesis protein CobT
MGDDDDADAENIDDVADSEVSESTEDDTDEEDDEHIEDKADDKQDEKIEDDADAAIEANADAVTIDEVELPLNVEERRQEDEEMLHKKLRVRPVTYVKVFTAAKAYATQSAC